MISFRLRRRPQPPRLHLQQQRPLQLGRQACSGDGLQDGGNGAAFGFAFSGGVAEVVAQCRVMRQEPGSGLRAAFGCLIAEVSELCFCELNAAFVNGFAELNLQA